VFVRMNMCRLVGKSFVHEHLFVSLGYSVGWFVNNLTRHLVVDHHQVVSVSICLDLVST